MAQEIVVSGGSLLDLQGERPADLLIAEGCIADIGSPGAFFGRGIEVDASDALVMPGFVDIQVHFRTPGGEDSEDIASGAAGAALGGVTACLMMPNTIPTIDNPELVSEVLALGRDTPCDVYTSAAITVDRAGERLVDFPALYEAGVRVFTDDGTVVDSADLMKGALEASASFPDVVISQHAEHSEMVEGGVINQGAVAERLGLKGRPSEAEVVIVERDIALARQTGGRYHVLHMSTAAASDLVRDAKAEGLRVTAEVTPQHLILTEEDVERLGTSGKMNPPLRTMIDVEGLRTALLDGTIDAVATDHAPHSPQSKSVGLPEAPPGMLGVETMASIVWDEFVARGLMTPQRFVNLLSVAPASIAGITAHGGPFTIGEAANIAVFDPGERWVIEPERLQSKSLNTPWPQKEVQGRVRHTICNGALVVHDATLV